MMLHAIRERAKGWFAWLIVILISVPFALWGIGSYITPDSNPPVALVDGNSVGVYEYKNAVQQESQNNGALKESQKKAVLERLINNKALLNHLHNQQYTVSDKQIDDFIRADENFQDENKQFSAEKLKQILSRSGLSYEKYRALLSEDLLIRQYIDTLKYSSFATPSEIQKITGLLKQKRKLDYVEISAEPFKAQIKIDETEAKDFYEQNLNQYEVPEKVTVEYILISRQALAQSIEVSEDQLRDSYFSRKQQFTQPEERQASHILITIDENIEPQKAKAKADEIYQKIQAGEDFAKLAKQFSQDPGSANNGGDLGFFKKGDMVPEFEKVSYELKEGEISKPFKTDFGYHIVKLDKIKASQIKAFDEVKDSLKSDLQFEQAEKIYVKKSEILQNLAFENPDELKTAAREVGLEIKLSDAFSRDSGNELFASSVARKVAFAEDVYENGVNSELINLGDDQAIVMRIVEKFPAKVSDFTEVKSRIDSFLVNKKANEQALTIAEQLKNAYNNAFNFEKILKANHLQLTPVGLVERDNREIPRPIISKAFSLPRPKQVDGVTVAELATVRMGNKTALVIMSGIEKAESDDEDLRKALSQMLLQAEMNRLSGASIEHIRAQAEVEIFSDRLPLD